MKKYLLVFVDVEGGVLRNGKIKGFFDITLLISGIIITKKNFHIYEYRPISLLTWTSDSSKNKHQSVYLEKIIKPQIDFIKKMNKVDRLLLCAWNAPHDRKVLQNILPNEKNKWIDLLSLTKAHAKKTDMKIYDFSLASLLCKYEADHRQKHTSFQDVLDMIFITDNILNSSKKVKSTKQQIENIVNHSLFLDFLEEAEKPIEAETKKEDLYNYFEIENKQYKINKTWKTTNGLNKGLYLKVNDNNWRLITGDKKKDFLAKYSDIVP